MKYIKFIVLGVFVILVVIPGATDRKIRVQRVSGEVKAEEIAPTVVEDDEKEGMVVEVVAKEKSYVIIDDLVTSEQEASQAKTLVAATEEKITSLKRPAAKYSYQLNIPKIAVDAPVLGLGLEPDGKMDVPDNYEEVGWYSLGAAPGQVGNAVLGAHVDNGSSISGVFKNLKKLEIGEDIYTTDKEGRKLHFKVTKIKTYDYQTRDTSEVFGNNGKSQLVLITCYGTFLPSEGTYDKRLIVFAELI